MNTIPDVINAFAQTTRPVILRYFNRRSCIASSRVAIEVLQYFGVEARAIPVRFVVRVPSLKMAFVSGLSPEEKRTAKRDAGEFVELQPGPEIRGGGSGWDGHVIVDAGGCLVDPSFDQALDAIAQQGRVQIDASPRVAVFPLDGRELPDYFEARFTGVLDDGTQIHIEYVRTADESFQLAPAWETDHLEPAIAEIIGRMEKLLERAA